MSLQTKTEKTLARKWLKAQSSCAKGLTKLNVLLGLLLGLVTIVQAFQIAAIVDHVFILKASLSAMLPQFYMLIGLLVGRSVLVYLRTRIGFVAGARVRAHIRDQITAKLIASGASNTNQFSTGEFGSLMLEHVEKCEGYFADYLPQMTLALLVPLMILVVVWSQNWLAGLILLLTMPLIPMFLAIFGMGAAALHEKNFAALSQMSAHFYDVLCGLATLKYFGRSKAYTAPIREVSESFRKRTMSVLYVAFLSSSVLEFFSALSVALLATYLGLSFLGSITIGTHGHLTLTTGLLILILAPEFFMPLRELNTHYHARSEAIGASVKLAEFLAINEMARGSEALDVPIKKIQLNGLGIRYEKTIVDDLNTTFEMGKRYAIVGPSGVGKTSLLNALLKLIEPASGEVLVNSKSLSQISPNAWYQKVAYLSQHSLLPEDTIGENLRFAKPDASDEQLWDVLEEVSLKSWVKSLPQGLETRIFEQKAGLSGGQANRLALARSILKDAPVWLLDEPTASLDAELAADLMNSIREHSEGKLLIMVTHDQRNLEWVDEILTVRKCREKMAQKLTQHFPALRGNSCVGASLCTQMKGELRLRWFKTFTRHKFAILAGLLLTTLTLIAGISLLALSGWFISAAAFAGLGAITASQFNYFLPAAGVRFFALIRILSRYGERVLTHQATFKILSDLRVGVYQLIEPLAPAHLIKYKSADLQSRLVSDIDALDHLYLRVFTPCISAVFAIVFVGVLFAYFDVQVAVIVVVTLLISGFSLPLLSVLLSNRTSKSIAIKQSNYRQQCSAMFTAITPILIYDQATRFANQTHSMGKQLLNAQKRVANVDALTSALFAMLSGLALLSVLWVACLHTYHSALDGAFIAFLALATMGAFEAVMPLAKAFSAWGQTRASINRINTLKNTKPEVTFSSESITLDPSKGLVMKDVQFAYGDKPVFKQLSLAIAPGQKIAITGQSGVGKSTLLHLLLRAFDPDAGNITLGGVNLKTIDEATLRSQIAIIRQNPYLFNSSIRENLSLLDPKITDRMMLAALERVQLKSWFDGLSSGLDTQVGEQGAALSGGQQRRLAIARAICFDAPIWLMDEPTEGLDMATELNLIKDMSPILKSKTLVLVTHRTAPLVLVGQKINLDQLLTR